MDDHLQIFTNLLRCLLWQWRLEILFQLGDPHKKRNWMKFIELLRFEYYRLQLRFIYYHYAYSFIIIFIYFKNETQAIGSVKLIRFPFDISGLMAKQNFHLLLNKLFVHMEIDTKLIYNYLNSNIARKEEKWSDIWIVHYHKNVNETKNKKKSQKWLRSFLDCSSK